MDWAPLNSITTATFGDSADIQVASRLTGTVMSVRAVIGGARPSQFGEVNPNKCGFFLDPANVAAATNSFVPVTGDQVLWRAEVFVISDVRIDNAGGMHVEAERKR